MQGNVVILADSKNGSSETINWAQLGTTVAGVSQLYQAVKDRHVDLILVGENRQAINQAVATRLRRLNGLTEIWKLVGDEFGDEQPEAFFDGQIPVAQGTDSLAQKIEHILADKELLARYRLIGRSGSLKSLARTIDRIAPTDVSVLIVGPSGSGKELVARALHTDSTRVEHPFVAINCGALSEGLLESELFGHEKGAFTGSVGKREGLFHKADGGTLFLDEIGETSLAMQVKLLRVLEDGTYYPVGSSTPRRANVRVVAATNRDLTEAIAERNFREDLYFRIAAVKLVVPPLLDRLGDIQPLLQHFWRDQKGIDYSGGAVERLMDYDWPGNVRQLVNFAARMSALKPTGLVETEDVDRFLAEQQATAKHLPVATGHTVEQAGQELIYRAILSLGSEVKMLRNLITSHLPSGSSGDPMADDSSALDSGSSMEEMEEALIRQVLAETNGNRKETARKLGIGERTLYRKIAKYDLK